MGFGLTEQVNRTRIVAQNASYKCQMQQFMKQLQGVGLLTRYFCKVFKKQVPKSQ